MRFSLIIGCSLLLGCTSTRELQSRRDAELKREAEAFQERKKLESQIYVLMHDVAAIRRKLDLAPATDGVGTLTQPIGRRFVEMTNNWPVDPYTPPMPKAAGGNWQDELRKLREELKGAGVLK